MCLRCGLMYNTECKLKIWESLNIIFLSLCVYLFKNCRTQFLSQRNSVFFLPKKKAVLVGKINFSKLLYVQNYTYLNDLSEFLNTLDNNIL